MEKKEVKWRTRENKERKKEREKERKRERKKERKRERKKDRKNERQNERKKGRKKTECDVKETRVFQDKMKKIEIQKKQPSVASGYAWPFKPIIFGKNSKDEQTNGRMDGILHRDAAMHTERGRKGEGREKKSSGSKFKLAVTSKTDLPTVRYQKGTDGRMDACTFSWRWSNAC